MDFRVSSQVGFLPGNIASSQLSGRELVPGIAKALYGREHSPVEGLAYFGGRAGSQPLSSLRLAAVGYGVGEPKSPNG